MGNSAVRTDSHNAVNLVTENYDYLGSLDWQESSPARMALINAVIVTPGRKWAGVHGSGQCDHCGARLRYAALMLHRPSDTVLEVGETCLENRFDRATADFQRLRKQAELDRGQQRIKKAVAEFVDANPDLAFLANGEIPAESAKNFFIMDVSRKLRTYGELSEKQVAAVRNSIVKDREFAAKKAAEVTLPTSTVVEGKIVVTGEVVSTKFVDNQFGSTYKMLVRDERGFKVFGSVPNNIYDVKRGQRVTFSATVTKSDSDNSFGFFSRPTKAGILA